MNLFVCMHVCGVALLYTHKTHYYSFLQHTTPKKEGEQIVIPYVYIMF